MTFLLRTVLPVVLITLSLGAPAQDTASAFSLEDQFEKLHSFTFPRDKPLVFSIADPGGAKDAPVWTDTIHEKYGDRIAFWSMANLSFIPAVARSTARLGIRATSKDPVLCDWDGAVSESLKSKKGHANVIVISKSGTILHRTFGKPTDEKLAKAYEAIDSALAESEEEAFIYARSRMDDLRLSTYITANSVNTYLGTEQGRRDAILFLKQFGITKLYVEVYRGGTVVEKTLLEQVRDDLLASGLEVACGIATVPGADFGVRQEGPLGWFNWQNEKTQRDLERVVRMAAQVFDEFIVDDFLCTGDVSAESNAARGNRSWGEYRRDLLTELSQTVFIGPAREENPDIKMIIKYPQWYDRFHLFGYDVVREPRIFDGVWIGTETRGAYTQRYGFVQPYEGFVNFRWLSSLAGEKTGGAWFDHGDCDAEDFIEQAYQTVMAGAREIILFNYNNLYQGHPGHALLKADFSELADLARIVRDHPVEGVAGYKPPHSDAGGDLYIMDYIGMLGVPLVPVSTYPVDAEVIFLPTQAATDPDIVEQVRDSAEAGKTLIFTAGFLAAASSEELARMAGVRWPIVSAPMNASTLVVNGKETDSIEYGVDLEARLTATTAESLLDARVEGDTTAFLTKNAWKGATIYVLNSHTFSQADFDAVGEVLLSPRPLGLLEIPRECANVLRDAFNRPLGLFLDAPTRVLAQPLGPSHWLVHNYNRSAVDFTLATDGNRTRKTRGHIEARSRLKMHTLVVMED